MTMLTILNEYNRIAGCALVGVLLACILGALMANPTLP
jgi:hypothetical protein